MDLRFGYNRTVLFFRAVAGAFLFDSEGRIVCICYRGADFLSDVSGAERGARQQGIDQKSQLGTRKNKRAVFGTVS